MKTEALKRQKTYKNFISNKMDIKFYNLDPGLSLYLWNKHIPKEKKSPLDFQRSLKKALSGNYTGLLFGENILEDKKRDDYLQKSLEEGFTPAIQITVPVFFSKKNFIQELNAQYSPSLFFNMIFDDVDRLPLEDIKPFLPQFLFTYVITKRNKNILFKQKLPKEALKTTEILFPYKERLFDPFLTPRQVYKFIKRQGPSPSLSKRNLR